MPFVYQDWWKRNGEAVRQRRRNRYRSDPSFREKQRQWSKDYRQKRQEELGDREPASRSYRRPIVVELLGEHGVERHVCWSVGVLAQEIGRGRRTIESWERKGLIPRTPIWWTGIRYYTEGMIRGLIDVLSTRQAGLRVTDPMVYYEVLAAWKEVGYDRFISDDQLSVSELDEVSIAGDLILLTVDALADKAGRSRRTLLHWERIGLLPETPLRYGEDRVYTLGMCDAVVAAMDARGDTVRVTDHALVKELREAWKRELRGLRSFGLKIRQGETINVKEIGEGGNGHHP